MRISWRQLSPSVSKVDHSDVKMSFLFKSKKNQPPASGLPQATRNIHTSEGTVSEKSPSLNGEMMREGGLMQSPTPSGSVNNSLHSIGGAGSPDPIRMRQRAESESQVSSIAPSKTIFHQLLSLVALKYQNSPRAVTNTDEGPTIPAVCQWRIPNSERQCHSISMVSASSKFYYTTIQSVSTLWRRGQFPRFEGRRHLHDGWLNRGFDGEG